MHVGQIDSSKRGAIVHFHFPLFYGSVSGRPAGPVEIGISSPRAHRDRCSVTPPTSRQFKHQTPRHSRDSGRPIDDATRQKARYSRLLTVRYFARGSQLNCTSTCKVSFVQHATTAVGYACIEL